MRRFWRIPVFVLSLLILSEAEAKTPRARRNLFCEPIARATPRATDITNEGLNNKEGFNLSVCVFSFCLFWLAAS
jgi:hypothetical protein